MPIWSNILIYCPYAIYMLHCLRSLRFGTSQSATILNMQRYLSVGDLPQLMMFWVRSCWAYDMHLHVLLTTTRMHLRTYGILVTPPPLPSHFKNRTLKPRRGGREHEVTNLSSFFLSSSLKRDTTSQNCWIHVCSAVKFPEGKRRHLISSTCQSPATDTLIYVVSN